MIPRHAQITIALLLIGSCVLAFYVLNEKRKAEEQQRRVADTRPVAPPVAGTPQRVVLVIAYDEEGVLRRREATVVLPDDRALRAREVLRALLNEYVRKPSPHTLAEGSDIKDVYLFQSNLAVIDTTAAFADAHRSGIFVESLTIVSMVETLAANVPGITRVKIVVEGKERETLAGHADLMPFYEVATVHDLVKEMQ
ncbi:MAG: GerMN domain-containing protein [Terriglobales bacterium]